MTLAPTAFAGLQRSRFGRVTFVVSFGLPLAAVLDVQAFAGIVTHELAHCRQGLAMRGVSAVAAVNTWLVAVLRQGPAWRRSLVAALEGGVAGAVAIILGPAVLVLAATHHVIEWLARAGSAVCAGLMRRMETDADRVAAFIAGSDAVVTELSEDDKIWLAFNRTLGLVAHPLHQGVVPDDLVACVTDAYRRITPRDAEEATARRAAETRALFDTHPPLAHRIRAVRALDTPGVLAQQGDATALFDDFAGLSRELTRLCWESARDKPRIVPAADYLARIDRTARTRDAVSAFFGVGQVFVIDPILPADRSEGDTADAATASAEEQIARHRVEALAYLRESEPLHKAEAALTAARLAHLLGLSFDPVDVGVPAAAIEEAGSLQAALDQALARVVEEQRRTRDGLVPFRLAVSQVIRQALGRQAARADGDREELDTLVRLVNATVARRASLRDATVTLRAMAVLTSLAGTDEDACLQPVLLSLAVEAAGRIRPTVDAVLDVTWSPDLPLDDTVRRARQALAELPPDVPLEQVIALLFAVYEAALASLLQRVGLAGIGPIVGPPLEATIEHVPDQPTNTAAAGANGQAVVVEQAFAASLRRRTPHVLAVPALLVAYLVAFSAMTWPTPLAPVTLERLVESGAFFAPLVRSGDWWRAVTACIVPHGVSGLLLTVGAVVAFGPEAERVLGTLVFACCYLATALLAVALALESGGSGVFTTSAPALLSLALVMSLIQGGLFTTGGGTVSPEGPPALVLPRAARVRVGLATAVLVLAAAQAGMSMLVLAVVVAFGAARFVAQDADVRRPAALPAAGLLAVAALVTGAEVVRVVGTADMRSEAAAFIVAEHRALRTLARAPDPASGGRQADVTTLVLDNVTARTAEAQLNAERRLREAYRDLAAAAASDRFGRAHDVKGFIAARDQVEVGTAFLTYLASRDRTWRLRIEYARQSRFDLLDQLERDDAAARMPVWRAITIIVRP